MKNAFLLTLALLAICLLFSCAEDGPDCPVSSKICEDALIDYLFNEGTYWIYSNSANAIIDSQSVYSSQKDTWPAGYPAEGCNVSSVGINCDWYCNIVSSVSPADSFRLYASQPPYSCIRILNANSTVNYQLGFNGFLLNKLPGQSDSSGVTALAYYDTLVIGDSIYNDVRSFHVPAAIHQVSGFQYDCDLYFARKVGIVRKIEYNTPSGIITWDLQRSNIIELDW